jgi:dephospho-CoA kinase
MNISTEIKDALQKIKETTPNVVGIDGTDGVGKTQLAKDIEKLGYKRISLDDFLKRESGGYFKFINFETLIKSIKQASESPIVIEGLLLRKILEKLSLTTNYYIYITDNVWIYDWLEEYQGKYYGLHIDDIVINVEREINRLNRIISPGSKPYKMGSLRKEIYEYSYEYKPWEEADIILETNL